MEFKDVYRKSYLMQAVGSDGNTIRTSVPKIVVEKEANRLKLTIEEFLEKYKVEWLFNSFPGIHGMFVPKEKLEKEKEKEG